jgi:mRNA degradation ribonuclease J1/J2
MHRKAIYTLPLSVTALALLLGAPLTHAQDDHTGGPGMTPKMEKDKKSSGTYGSPSETDAQKDKKDKDKEKNMDKKKKDDEKDKSGDMMR